MTVTLGLITFGDVAGAMDGGPFSHAQAIRDIVEEGILADRAGLDFFGVGEHHRADYAVSCPDTVLASIGSRTARIRLGATAAVLTADDPVRLFQRLATLNAVTRGRAEVVVGRGWFLEPLHIFGVEVARQEEVFEEKLHLLTSLLRSGTVARQGGSRPSLAGRRIYPAVPEWTPRLWVAVGANPNSALRAARHDAALMIAAIGGEPGRLKPLADIYRAGCQRLGRQPREVGVHSPGYVAETDALALEEFWPGYKAMRDRLGAERGWPPFSRAQFEAEVSRGSLYVGAPETVAKRIAATIRLFGANRFDMRYSAGGLPHHRLAGSIELFGRHVAPLVRSLVSAVSD